MESHIIIAESRVDVKPPADFFETILGNRMVVEKIGMRDFRNYAREEIPFFPKINLITGGNAEGKTNLLEGVYFCCIGKSQRAKDKELISFDKPAGKLLLQGKNAFGEVEIGIRLSRKENKSVLLNGISVKRTAELLGNIDVVYFSPDELKLIKDAPQSRRRFLDTDISQIYKQYYDALTRYNKILLQRNNLLKKRSLASVRDTVEVWDRQLAKFACVIVRYREEFLEKLAPYAAEVHKTLSSGKEELSVSYACTSKRDPAEFAAQLAEKLERDFELGFTSVGPHRDDIRISVNGTDVRMYGSQGQQRSAALSLKLAELRLFREIVGEYPVLILDDVLSELDLERQRNLLKLCVSQTLISAAHVDESLLREFDCNVIRIKSGTLLREE